MKSIAYWTLSTRIVDVAGNGIGWADSFAQADAALIARRLKRQGMWEHDHDDVYFCTVITLP